MSLPVVRTKTHIIRPAAGLDDILRCNVIASEHPKWSGALYLELENDDEHLVVAVNRRTKEIDGYCHIFNERDDLLYLNDITLSKRAQGQGLASRLLDYLIGLNRHVFLYVNTDNKRAQRLYARKGFLYAGTVQRFYAHEGDAYKMVKPNDDLGWIDLDDFSYIEPPADDDDSE